jgi:hypothetical protein
VGAPQLVGAPNDEGEAREERELGRAERRRTEDVLEEWHVDEGGGEEEFEEDAQSSIGLVNRPTERREAYSVRAARAVPTWHVTMPAKVMVVACR